MKGRVDIVQDGVRHVIPTEQFGRDPSAADVNAVLRANGIDVTRVQAVTPAGVLLERLKLLEMLEQGAKDAAAEVRAWRDWLDRVRFQFDGLYAGERQRPTTWAQLAEAVPWPSLEDERAEAAADE
jgi:hypothetical protein